jgi:hypothetical protein
MTTATESATNLYEETFGSLRKATESALQFQQQMYSKWSTMCPGLGQSNTDWNTNLKKLQKDWATMTTEVMRKHRAVLDQQYRSGIESLEEAFRLASAKDPAEFRDRCEALCRSALDLMKESSESQMRQFQEAMNKWVELCQTKP